MTFSPQPPNVLLITAMRVGRLMSSVEAEGRREDLGLSDCGQCHLPTYLPVMSCSEMGLVTVG